jgi:hypothetical protein
MFTTTNFYEIKFVMTDLNFNWLYFYQGFSCQILATKVYLQISREPQYLC